MGELTCLTSGVFVISSDSERCTYAGIVSMPNTVNPERVYSFRVNTGIWINVNRSEDGRSRWGRPAVDADAQEIISSMRFKAGFPNLQEMYVRRADVQNSEPGMSWYQVFGASKERSRHVLDGLYTLVSLGTFHMVTSSTPPKKALEPILDSMRKLALELGFSVESSTDFHRAHMR